MTSKKNRERVREKLKESNYIKRQDKALKIEDGYKPKMRKTRDKLFLFHP